MQEEKFSPQESLQLIDSIINQAKNRFTENGFLYLLWGWIIFISAIFHFVALKFQLLKHPEVIWFSTIPAIIYQIYYLIKASKKEQVKTYSDEIINAIWMCFGICMGLLSFISGRLDLWMFMYPLVLLFYGIPTFLSGVVMRFTPLKIGAIVCWGLSATSTFVSPLYYLLLLSLAVLSAWIIPGYLLRKKYNQQNNRPWNKIK